MSCCVCLEIDGVAYEVHAEDQDAALVALVRTDQATPRDESDAQRLLAKGRVRIRALEHGSE